MPRPSKTLDLERELWQRKRHGDQQAREQLIFRHLVLAKKIARRYANRGETIEDLIQVATVGLINAIDRFDPNRGLQFSTFAVPTILGAIKRHFRDGLRLVKTPRDLSDLESSIAEVEDTLTQQFSRPPTVEEIAEHLEVSSEQVLNAILARDSSKPQSLVPLLVDSLGAPDPEIQEIEGSDLVGQVLDAMARLDKRSREVIHLCCLEGKTQTEAARLMGYTQMHISRLLQQGIEQIRKLLQEGG